MKHETRPNILWYCTDQQRYDTLRCTGNPHVRTPNIDALSERGVTFLRAYAQSTVCTPSRASFLTGRYPAAHGVHRNGVDLFPETEQLVTGILADAGYTCGLVGKLHLSRADIVERRPRNDGYSYYQWSHHPRPTYDVDHAYAAWLRHEKHVDPKELFSRHGCNIGPGVPAELHQTTWCTEMSIRFLEQQRNSGKPWLLSVNPFDPHPPFDPAPEYFSRYSAEDMPMPLFRESDLVNHERLSGVYQQTKTLQDHRSHVAGGRAAQQHDQETPSGMIPPSHYDPQLVKACYYAMVEHVDHEFGRIIDYLSLTGQLENTIVLFHSDHGELLGDHGLLYKGCRFFEALPHVPLVMSWPAGWSRGVVSNALVELVDLAPTLLEAIGMGVPTSMQGTSLCGISNGSRDSSYHKRYVVSEFYDSIADEVRSDDDPSHGIMVFDGRYKTSVYNDPEMGEIYDLEADPGEFDNLWFQSEDSALKAGLLRTSMSAYMRTVSAGRPRLGLY